MKVLVTGTSSGFGKYFLENSKFNVVPYSMRKKDVVTATLEIQKINPHVFFNHAYSGTMQSQLFANLFDKWSNESKTIINFGSSATTEHSGFSPRYVADKAHLNRIGHQYRLGFPRKSLRVVNMNPGTLENNTSVDPIFNRITFDKLLAITEYIIDLPQDIEISDITIKSTMVQQKRAL
jgi:NAD(P)-dependent dehydrogenase (short-subunit alcohol dehydrogenase family)